MSFTETLQRARTRLAASCAALAAACGPPAPAPRPLPPSGQGDAAATHPPAPAAPAALPASAGASTAALLPAPAAASTPAGPPAAASGTPAAPAASAALPGLASRPRAAAATASAPRAATHAGGAPPRAGAAGAVPSAGGAASWEQFRLQAARRIVQVNPGITYMGPAPDPLLAIPVLEIELEADGRVRRIGVLRHPRQARDTVRIAIDAVHRAAPFGDVSRLPRPRKFVETFLFDDRRRFKPRSLDDG